VASVTAKASLFSKLSIRAKLLWIIMLTSGVALGVAGIAIVSYDSLTFTRAKLNDLSTQAEILGSISEAALDFNDAQAAREYLSSLKARPDIVSGVIYDSAGQVFASYFRKGSDDGGKLVPPPKAEADGHRSEDGECANSGPDGRVLGETIYHFAADRFVDRCDFIFDLPSAWRAGGLCRNPVDRSRKITPHAGGCDHRCCLDALPT